MKTFLIFLLTATLAFGQAATNVQKGGAAGGNNITGDLTIGTGRTLTIASGGTFVLSGSFTPGAGTIAWSALTGQPTTLSGYGITDGVSINIGYPNPAWITSLASTKLTGTLSSSLLPVFSGDLSSAGNTAALTLNTVNANTGTFGDSGHVGTFTVNNKGLITGAGSAAVTVASTGISDSTATGRALITAGNPAAARSTLGLATVAATGSYTDLTNQPTFNTFSPMTTLGDTIYGAAAGAGTRLPGNTTTTKQFLTQTGTGSVSAATVWAAIVNADVPSVLTGKTYNGLTVTPLSSGFSIAGGTSSHTLTVPLDATVSGSNTGDQTITLSGDVTGSGTAGITTTLATVNSNVGSFGSGALVSTFTVDAKGRITQAGTATSTPGFSNITGKPTTAAGYGITNGANIDAWGLKAVPSGVVADLTSTQAFTGKTYEGHTWTTGSGSLTQGGNVTFAGAFTTALTVTANTAITLPTSGTLATIAGTEGFSNKAITLSTVDSSPIGATTPSTGSFTTGNFSGDLALGGNVFFGLNAPISVRANGGTSAVLNIGGEGGINFQTGTGFAARGSVTDTGFQGPIGATTPAAGTFTTGNFSGDITGTGNIVLTKATPQLVLSGTESGALIGSIYENAGFLHFAHSGTGDAFVSNLSTLETDFFGVVSTSSGFTGVTVSAAHFLGTGTAPTVAPGTGAGASPTLSVSGHDSGFTISLLTGTTPISSAVVATVTFHAAYSTAPHFSLTASSLNALTLSGVSAVLPSSTTTTFVLTAGSVPLTASTAYTWEVLCVQ